MSLELCILASGSAGNAAILRSPAGVLLIDAGIGPHTLATRLEGTGVQTSDISAVCLTHLDVDHFSPSWVATLCRLKIPIYCHANKVETLKRCSNALTTLIRPFAEDTFSPLSGITCDPIRFAHDELGSHGFVIDGFSYRIGYATDLGHVPSYFFRSFRDLDCIALESNYDPQMQADSGRPIFLQRRITGGRGHLSNLQALAAVTRLLDRARHMPDHIVLLHRSQECNCPKGSPLTAVERASATSPPFRVAEVFICASARTADFSLERQATKACRLLRQPFNALQCQGAVEAAQI